MDNKPDKPFIDHIAELCHTSNDAKLWMVKFCSAMDRDNIPEPETLEFFKERFEEILRLTITEDVPADELRDKLPVALGVKVRPPGNPPLIDEEGRTNLTLLARSASFQDACAVKALVDAGVKATKAYEQVAGARSVSTVKKSYLEHRKSIRN